MKKYHATNANKEKIASQLKAHGRAVGTNRGTNPDAAALPTAAEARKIGKKDIKYVRRTMDQDTSGVNNLVNLLEEEYFDSIKKEKKCIVKCCEENGNVMIEEPSLD